MRRKLKKKKENKSRIYNNYIDLKGSIFYLFIEGWW